MGRQAVEQNEERELQERRNTSQTDLLLHLNFPGELYLNETSQSRSVEANSRRTEEYFNHDTKH